MEFQIALFSSYVAIIKVPYSKKICGNSDFETLAEKLWRIQGLPAFLVHDSSDECY